MFRRTLVIVATTILLTAAPAVAEQPQCTNRNVVITHLS